MSVIPTLLAGAPLVTSAGSVPEVPPTTWAFVDMPSRASSGSDFVGLRLGCVAGTSLTINAYEDTSSANNGSSLQALENGQAFLITTNTIRTIPGVPTGRRIWIKITAVSGAVTTLLGEAIVSSPGPATINGSVSAIVTPPIEPANIDFTNALSKSVSLTRIGKSLYGATLRVDSSLASGTFFLQVFDAAAGPPANGAAPNVMGSQPFLHVNGADPSFDDTISIELPEPYGPIAAVNLTFAVSTTFATLTLVGTNCLQLIEARTSK